jgi:nitrate reductase beta subunit
VCYVVLSKVTNSVETKRHLKDYQKRFLEHLETKPGNRNPNNFQQYTPKDRGWHRRPTERLKEQYVLLNVILLLFKCVGTTLTNRRENAC